MWKKKNIFCSRNVLIASEYFISKVFPLGLGDLNRHRVKFWLKLDWNFCLINFFNLNLSTEFDPSWRNWKNESHFNQNIQNRSKIVQIQSKIISRVKSIVISIKPENHPKYRLHLHYKFNYVRKAYWSLFQLQLCE